MIVAELLLEEMPGIHSDLKVPKVVFKDTDGGGEFIKRAPILLVIDQHALAGHGIHDIQIELHMANRVVAGEPTVSTTGQASVRRVDEVGRAVIVDVTATFARLTGHRTPP